MRSLEAELLAPQKLSTSEVAARLRPATPQMSLESKIRSLGIPIPNQSKMLQMMEAARIGLPPTASALRIRIAWYRRWKSEDYTVFAYDKFVECDPSNNYGSIAYVWGGMPPEVVDKHVKLIRANYPEIDHEVPAKKDDPWHVLVDGDERLVLHGWMRSGPHEKVELIV